MARSNDAEQKETGPLTQCSADTSITKYLRTRAITSPWRLNGFQDRLYKAVIVIPAFDEAESLPKTLASLEKNPPELLDQTLVIVIVNNRICASFEQKTQNQQTLQWLQKGPCSALNLAWIDATTTGFEFPEKDGVGLARKIGFDLALGCMHWAADPLYISLDADSLVDNNYLGAIFQHFESHSCVGAYLPFRHQTGETPAQELAIREYELYLRSYKFGLDWAGSPFAFFSIGSAFACRARSYVAVGGMKRRLAGEDFYFLQQLVKTGQLTSMHGTLVSPAARYSKRVPFGTGRAIEARVEQEKSLYRFISVSSFRILKEWLQSVARSKDSDASTLMAQAGEISPQLLSFLDEAGFSEVWKKLQVQHASTQFMGAWLNWFDGLKTRQLLTALEKRHLPAEPELLVSELLEAGGYPGITQSSLQLELLENLQNCR
jgi:glycosyltransferase involved in cell wall biosynthesis